MSHHTPPPSVQMLQMITGFWTSCCIYVVAKLGIPDLIATTAKDAEQLAKETGTHEDSLYRVLRALSSVGVLDVNGRHEFSLTELGQTLRSDVYGSMRAMAIAQLGDHFAGWGNLMHSVKTGEIGFDDASKKDIWAHYKENPEDGDNFTKAMMGMTQMVVPALVPAFDFNQFNTIADIGGGNGALMCGILKQTINPRGIVFDGDYVAQLANDNILANNLSGRCSFHEGDFFDKVDVSADAFLLKMILHDWNDEKSNTILHNVAQAMKPGNKLLIMESVIPTDNSPHPGKFLDINMLVMTGGKERTELEWRILIEKAGLKFNRIHPTMAMMGIIEAEKV